MKQQTAVEWLWNEISEILPFSVNSEIAIKAFEKMNQAKAMEKEQIVKSYKIGFNDAYDNAKYDYEPLYNNGEKYYQETYKK